MAGKLEKRLSQTAAINRALASDLDTSRRIIADLSRERESLKSELSILKSVLLQVAASRVGLQNGAEPAALLDEHLHSSSCQS